MGPTRECTFIMVHSRVLSGCTQREGQLGMRCWMKTWWEGAASVVAGVLCPRTVEKGDTDRGKRSGLGWEEGEVPHVNLRTLSRTEWRPCLCISGVWNPDLSRTLWQEALGGSHLVPQRRAPGMAVLGRRGSAGGRARTHTTRPRGSGPPRRARPAPTTPPAPTQGSVDPAPRAAHAPSASRDLGRRAPCAPSPPAGRARRLPRPLQLPAAAAAAAGIVFVVAEAGRAAGAGSLSPGQAPPPPRAQRPRPRSAPPQRQYSGDQTLRGGGGGARSGRRRGAGRGGPRRRHGGAGTR